MTDYMDAIDHTTPKHKQGMPPHCSMFATAQQALQQGAGTDTLQHFLACVPPTASMQPDSCHTCSKLARSFVTQSHSQLSSLQASWTAVLTSRLLL